MESADALLNQSYNDLLLSIESLEDYLDLIKSNYLTILWNSLNDLATKLEHYDSKIGRASSTPQRIPINIPVETELEKLKL